MTNGFKIIGISTRTTNQNNQAQQDLENLWNRFFADNIMGNIPNKVSNEIIAIYTDYKVDFTEDYTTIIGIRVSTLDDIPAGLIGREFEGDHFKKFIAKGEVPDAVANTWRIIWQKDKELNRKYTYDFEVYGEKSQNGENSEVDIFIAIEQQ
ncbi:MAG TPA: GyrI-like domain-containing protein [Chitinophagales bacterium]|nr:GyrI-like domain-containing protein [Chitinophagales bacterium]